jgi:hypothetical protein
MDHSKLNLTKNENLRIREENINRNKRFLADLGFGEHELLGDDHHNESKPNHKAQKSIADDKPDQQLRRSKRLVDLTFDEQRKCEDCKSDKIFGSRRALNIHKTKYCVKRKDYVPDQFRLSQSRTTYDNFLLQERGVSTTVDNTIVLNKPLFNVAIEDTEECDEENVLANESMEIDNAENV